MSPGPARSSPGRARLAVALLAGVAACGGAAPGGTIAGIHVGAPVDPADPRLAPGDRGAAHVLRDPGSFEGQPLDGVRILVDGGVVTEVELSAAAREEAVAALASWFQRVCARIGSAQTDSFTPSPLGTPDPDDPEDWDPVITTTTRCAGTLDGLAIAARLVENQASDFRNAHVTITATRPAPAE